MDPSGNPTGSYHITTDGQYNQSSQHPQNTIHHQQSTPHQGISPPTQSQIITQDPSQVSFGQPNGQPITSHPILHPHQPHQQQVGSHLEQQAFQQPQPQQQHISTQQQRINIQQQQHTAQNVHQQQPYPPQHPSQQQVQVTPIPARTPPQPQQPSHIGGGAFLTTHTQPQQQQPQQQPQQQLQQPYHGNQGNPVYSQAHQQQQPPQQQQQQQQPQQQQLLPPQIQSPPPSLPSQPTLSSFPHSSPSQNPVTPNPPFVSPPPPPIPAYPSADLDLFSYFNLYPLLIDVQVYRPGQLTIIHDVQSLIQDVKGPPLDAVIDSNLIETGYIYEESTKLKPLLSDILPSDTTAVKPPPECRIGPLDHRARAMLHFKKPAKSSVDPINQTKMK